MRVEATPDCALDWAAIPTKEGPLPMLRRLIIVLALVVMVLTSLGGHALAYDPCIPGVDDSACIPPNPV